MEVAENDECTRYLIECKLNFGVLGNKAPGDKQKSLKKVCFPNYRLTGACQESVGAVDPPF